MMDRYQYLEKLYHHAHGSSFDGLAERHLARTSEARFEEARRSPTRAPRVHFSRTQDGSSSEVLLLALGIVSGLGALAVALYQLAA